ncbi:hypothetical protein [Hymenobacter gelipurpurascens]|nr:hypothetical protein [Hymenobacter gelipurpurascens]
MDHTETVGQRFLKLISHLGISKNAFAASLDKTATVIQHLVDERNKPGFDLLCKVFDVYPNVSKDWLLQGIGPMLTDDVSDSPESEKETRATAAAVAQAGNVTENTPTPQLNTPADRTSSEPIVAAAEVPRPLQEPAVAPAVAQMPTAVPEPAAVLPTTAVATGSPMVAPVSAPADSSWQAALYTQQMAHQLALAELRNQHLQDQQRLMQQMMDLMQRQLTR